MEQDFAQAVQWYRKAAEQGHVLAQDDLAFCYGNGVGTKQDLAQAVEWYRKAAQQGSEGAKLRLNDLGESW